MKIYKTRNYEDMSRKAANIIAAQITLNPDSVLGLATGSTPLGIYKHLIDQYQNGDIDFSNTVSVNLDEYKGLGNDHPQSYRWFMQKNFFDHINIQPCNTHLPDGLAENDQAECARFDQVIADCGGIDLQLLGLGHNGHIGFNEPGNIYEKGTHVVSLSETTIEANARFFENHQDVPRFAFTMGIHSILQARHILIVVSGKEKAGIVQKAFQGPITPAVPASVLQLHSHVTLVADADALSKME